MMAVAIWVLIAVCVLLLLLWLVARFYLSGPRLVLPANLSSQHFADTASSAQAQAVLAKVEALRSSTARVPLRQRLAATRRAWEALFADQPFDARFVAVDADGVRGEWVLAPGADPTCRTLYIHGGAYALGSPHSHRPLTVALSQLTAGAVFAVDYRLLPEHKRRAGIADCRQAWRWLLAQGPGGPEGAQRLFLAGDSAGGNLALSLIAWLRDTGQRQPDAVAVLSPQTDCTLASPSLKANLATDPLLGPTFEPLLGLPRSVLLYLTWLQHRINPRDPVVSPLFGDLSGLPPTLLQVSASEMLLDDARLYAARASAAGSPVQLQIWDEQVHVWQLFNPELAPAVAALAQIARFFEQAPAATGTSTATRVSA